MTRRGPYRPDQRKTKPPRTTGERIKALRHRVGWTQKELAGLLHLPTHQAVGNWEREESKPMPHLAEQIGRLFGQSREAILEGEGFDLTKVPSLVAPGPVVVPPEGGEAIPLSPLHGNTAEVYLLDSRRSKVYESGNVLKELANRLKQNRPVWIIVGPPETEDAPSDPKGKPHSKS